MLQWGRDHVIAEIAPERTALASMGPRSRDRGNLDLVCQEGVTVLLQWGRDHVIAEMCVIDRQRSNLYRFNGAAIT